MRNIIISLVVLSSFSNVFSQIENKWTLNEIVQSIENRNEFIENLVIEKNYYQNNTDYFERNNISLFVNGEQSVYIYPISTKFFFTPKNATNYNEIIDQIRKTGKRIKFEENIIREKKVWVLTYRINDKYFFIYKDSANNRYMEISKNDEIK